MELWVWIPILHRCVLVSIYMMSFYSWFNRCNSDEPHFFCFNLNLPLECSPLSFECSKLPFVNSLLKSKCLLLSFEYKKFIWCYMLVCMCASSKWHHLREHHSVKNLKWRLPTGIFETGKTSTKLPTNSRLIESKWEFG